MHLRAGSLVALAAPLLLSYTMPLVAADTVVRQIDEHSVLVVDFSGKPPFKRRVVGLDELPAAELARFEEVSQSESDQAARAGEQVTVVDFRGKPPFRRRAEYIDATTEFARFEESDQDEERPLRPRFSGKPFPVKR